MASPFYVTIDGKLQGKFKGSSTDKNHEGAIIGIAFSYELTIPREPGGQAAAKRQHSPVTFTKAWDAATPQLILALVENEPLRTVVFEFVRSADGGSEEVYHTITLSQARVSAVRQHVGGLAGGSTAAELEDVSFTFARIEIKNLPENTVADDDLAPIA